MERKKGSQETALPDPKAWLSETASLCLWVKEPNTQPYDILKKRFFSL